jgi:hypothetical protein
MTNLPYSVGNPGFQVSTGNLRKKTELQEYILDVPKILEIESKIVIIADYCDFVNFYGFCKSSFEIGRIFNRKKKRDSTS